MIKISALNAVFKKSLNLKKIESCLILTDTKQKEVAVQFYNFAKTITKNVRLEVMKPLKEHGQEPLKKIANLMKNYNVQLLITSKSLTHTKARTQANKKGARIASMPGITENIANRCLNVDYKKLRKTSIFLSQKILKSKYIHIKTNLGTNLTANTSNCIVHHDNGIFNFPGSFGNLPAGEVDFSPSRSKGIFIVDGSAPGIGKIRYPITFKVKKGFITEIKGKNSNKIKKRLDNIGPKAYLLAEIGIGINSEAKIIGNILEDEKTVGTVHIALGNNTSYNRFNRVPIHLDVVIKNPTIYLDKTQIMKDGKLLVKVK